MDGFVDLSAGLECGCYALKWRGTIVYVGKSTRLFARLANHLSNFKRTKHAKRARVKGILFDEVWFKQCSIGEIDELERSLIAKYRPRYNERNWHPEKRRLDLIINGRHYVLNPDAPVAPRQLMLRRL